MNKAQIKAKQRRREIREQIKRSRSGRIRTFGEWMAAEEARERRMKSLKGG